jgi:hypothetical protein
MPVNIESQISVLGVSIYENGEWRDETCQKVNERLEQGIANGSATTALVCNSQLIQILAWILASG